MAPNGRTRAGFVLAGGKSSRMGEDKAFLEFGGQSLLDRALAVMAAVCGSVTIVGDPAKFSRDAAKNSTPVIADIFPGCGPLGGIHTALVHSTAEFNLMLAVDMPFVPVELLSFLFTTAENNVAAATVARVNHLLQPLCAVYRREFSNYAEQSLRAGKFKIGAVLGEVALHLIEEPELVAAGFSAAQFFNVNTPEDRSLVERRLQ